ncbi:DUF3261 domain-containing protein [Chitinibacter sp. SCUT-21]|uniref:DUF3261 domain-containing protein n=1 Tax=Chitinibacter sp. SCUT-21 TaxID=2970891 RepID=UPI0035A5859C
MKTVLRSLLLALSCLLLLACSTRPTAQLPTLMPVSAFGTLAQSELVTLTAGEQVFAFTARIESDGQVLQLVAITPTGQRLFSFTRQGDELIAEPGPLWPKRMPLEMVWHDFELTHAQPAAALGADWQKVIENGVEHWSYRGQAQAQIVREATKIQLLKKQYQLTIEVLPE